ncbi:hypothetical protein DTO280E4_9134 [Paecilomyces variotii]|nr:hypothetical protein DTO021C3_8962 [Paecilomyces variotii]KAJ9349133.1 hypothetical protein DTO280E4_9134 [Paecilomyces variotii]
MGQQLDDVRVVSQDERTQHLDLTKKPAHEVLNQEPQNSDTGSRSFAPDARPPSPSHDLRTSAESAPQPMPDLNRPYMAKTGCFTCGRRRKTCDKKQPSCGVCGR